MYFFITLYIFFRGSFLVVEINVFKVEKELCLNVNKDSFFRNNRS